MIILQIITLLNYNTWLKRLDTERNEPINKRVPKVVKLTNKQTLI